MQDPKPTAAGADGAEPLDQFGGTTHWTSHLRMHNCGWWRPGRRRKPTERQLPLKTLLCLKTTNAMAHLAGVAASWTPPPQDLGATRGHRQPGDTCARVSELFGKSTHHLHHRAGVAGARGCGFDSAVRPLRCFYDEVTVMVMHRRPCGLMDKALVFGTKECRFKSCPGQTND